MAEKILIIDDDVDTLRLVGLMLQKQGYQILAATNGLQGLEQAESNIPDIILLDVMMPEMDGYEVARRLRANAVTVDIPILMFTAKAQLDDKVSGFEAGADDYLTKPTHPSELQTHVRALLSRSSQNKERLDAGRAKLAHVVGILAARGGFGVTSAAVNVGSILENITEENVIVAELRPGQGTIALELDQPAESGLTALLNLDSDNLTREQVKNELYVHDRNFSLLLASHNPHDASLLSAISHFEIILNLMRQLASYVILDLGPGLPELTQRLIKRCDQVIVIVEPVPNSVQHSAVLIADLVELGVKKDMIRVVVVNRVRSDTQMNWVQVQEKLDTEVSVAITPAPELFMEATRKKMLPVDIQPESITGQQFMKLAQTIVNQSQRIE